MILDGRHSSLCFSDTDKVELASGGAFSQIVVDGGVADGRYPVRIVGSNGNVARTLTLTLLVGDVPDFSIFLPLVKQ